MTSPRDLPQTIKALDVLQSLGIRVERDRFLVQMEAFHRLCSTWNLAAKLISKGDLEERFDEHIADSLTLCPEVAAHSELNYVDIGSGGGFPAIPIALALANRKVWLVERSERKAEYLKQAVKALGLNGSQVVLGQFPVALAAPDGRIYTARAVERPEVFDAELIKHLRIGDIYLMQREIPASAAQKVIMREPVLDVFGETGLRRGILYRLTR